jgi:phage terminase large subunit
MLSRLEHLQLALNPAMILEKQGLRPDGWQREFLQSPERQVLLNASRQSGKSTVVAALALHTALFHPGSLALLLSPTQRQSHELFRKVLDAYRALGRPCPSVQDALTMSKLELVNGSRIIGLPGKEQSIRSFSKVSLLLLDEAARVPDDLYRSLRPMLAVSHGRLVALSTPFGQRGWFYDEWSNGGEDWRRFLVPWTQCPRITPAFIASERRSCGNSWVQQEFECMFTALEGLVYPDFEKCVWDAAGVAEGKLVGGIDWGFRNPFAAVWGALDHDDVLWIVDEHYRREWDLTAHAEYLKKRGGKRICWYADPAGATDIAEFRRAGFVVRGGDNSIRAGIQAVTARIQSGRLRVNRSSCMNLIEEARLYRYPRADEMAVVKENPVDRDNHALAALRYLVAGIDRAYMARLRRSATRQDEGLAETESGLIIAEAELEQQRLADTARARGRIKDEDNAPVETPAERHHRLINDPNCWS